MGNFIATGAMPNHVTRARDSSTRNFARKIRGNLILTLAVSYLLFIVLLAIFGRFIVPYDPASIETIGVTEPSREHPLGTTSTGYDILSRLIYGAMPTVITGLLGGALIIGIGATIGVTSGYMGGLVDDILMRFTDMMYSIPVIPFAIVLVAMFPVTYYGTIIIIGALLWRGNARVLRSQVLQIREREYVHVSRATGAGPLWIMRKHIVPNIRTMMALFFALGIGYAIIIQAGLAFLGMTNPFVPSWGVMIRNAFNAGYMTRQPTWSLLPGFMISMTVLATFMIAREFEERPGQMTTATTTDSFEEDN